MIWLGTRPPISPSFLRGVTAYELAAPGVPALYLAISDDQPSGLL
jgi:hypothetical protein